MQALQESARPVLPRRAFCVALSPRPRSTQDYSVPAPPRVQSAPGPRGRCRAAGFWRREPLNRVSRLSEESRTAHGASDIQRCLEVDPRVVLRLSRDEPVLRHRGAARAKAPAEPVGRKPPTHPVASGPIGMLTFVKFPLSNLRKDPHVWESRLPSGTRRNGGSAPAPGHALELHREGPRLCSATSGPITLRARSFSNCGCQA
jgi:hypothetical protein